MDKTKVSSPRTQAELEVAELYKVPITVVWQAQERIPNGEVFQEVQRVMIHHLIHPDCPKALAN